MKKWKVERSGPTILGAAVGGTLGGLCVVGFVQTIRSIIWLWNHVRITIE